LVNNFLGEAVDIIGVDSVGNKREARVSVGRLVVEGKGEVSHIRLLFNGPSVKLPDTVLRADVDIFVFVRVGDVVVSSHNIIHVDASLGVVPHNVGFPKLIRLSSDLGPAHERVNIDGVGVFKHATERISAVEVAGEALNGFIERCLVADGGLSDFSK